ncbi:hypothetical protein HELRODRAFT_163269 [Helobdella robusta]|uniref:Band 7 domain-containing protein n=1 Tax=Helobdella robusta TaxID=6412 RepID=T1ETU9_HELRO|nr:hypothetical protein HELRODRAFT_163269 [Helobdella robusta]ESN96226.1 hypothetical protein HELRODRAFT_163269 [Helobdella robusta]
MDSQLTSNFIGYFNFTLKTVKKRTEERNLITGLHPVCFRSSMDNKHEVRKKKFHESESRLAERNDSRRAHNSAKSLVNANIPENIYGQVVQEYERAVIFRLGRLFSGGAKGPGIFFVLPCIESYTKVDLRTVSFDVPPQEVLTKDSVTVSVDAVVYYRVSNATVSVANVENAHHSTRLLAQTTLRNVLGTRNLSEILSERESISTSMQNNISKIDFVSILYIPSTIFRIQLDSLWQNVDVSIADDVGCRNGALGNYGRKS